MQEGAAERAGSDAGEGKPEGGLERGGGAEQGDDDGREQVNRGHVPRQRKGDRAHLVVHHGHVAATQLVNRWHGNGLPGQAGGR